ncbi:AAA family ATPase [Desulfovibrio sp. OttesenSCG-928-G15]|nr:AAA family ATPase [Desulfovibrio sp. OttesenSCG-928-G15]
MLKQFVATENYQRFVAGIQATEARGAAEAGILLVYGAPGRGKTHVVEHWVDKNDAIFLRANVDWTPKYFLVELCKVLGVDPKGHAQSLFERCLEVVIDRQKPLVIDEAEHCLTRNAAVFEKIRDITDRAEITTVCIGMDKILREIAKFKQIHSRIARVVEFKALSEEDVSLACQKLSEVVITPGLAAEVHRLCSGRMREVLNIIASIERAAKMNGLATVDVKDMQGVALSYDWNAKKHTTVKKAV